MNHLTTLLTSKGYFHLVIKRCLYIFAFIFLSLSTEGQQRSFYTISTNDGLSQNSVTSIVQDGYGFMWIATQDGLNRYDGNHFKKYPAYFADVTAEDYSLLGRLYKDGSDRVWALTLEGNVSYYDETSDGLITVANVTDASAIIEKSTNEFWVGSITGGLYQLSQVGDGWKLESIVNSIAIYNLTVIGDDLLLATNKGIVSFDHDKVEIVSPYPELQNYQVSDILLVRDSSLIVSTYSDGLYEIGEDGLVKRISTVPNNARVQDIHRDQSDNIWIATFDDGIYLIDDENTSHMLDATKVKSGIGYNDILCIYEDKRGDIWLGTDGGGISLNRKNNKKISSVVGDDMPEEVYVDVSRAITRGADGDLWIGTSGKGLTRISNDGASAVNYNNEKEGEYFLPYNRIVSLCHDRQDRLWIGTQEGGLLSLDNKFQRIRQVEVDINTIWQIVEKSENHLWLCTRNHGLVDYNTVTNTWINHYPESSNAELDNPSIRVVLPTNVSNEYYVGTDDGDVFLFDDTNGSFKQVNIKAPISGVKSLYLDGRQLWIGAQGQGVIIHDLTDKSVQRITTENGLPNNVIYAILEQDSRYVWVSTNQGLGQIDKVKVAARSSQVVAQTLNYRNGLICNEFNTGSYHKDEDGRLYFGGIEGVVWFDPENVQKDTSPVELLFLELNISDDAGSSSLSLFDKEKVELNYSQRSFQISYTDLTYVELDNLRFEYRLKGHNQTWIDNLNSRLANFTNVPPGNYELELRAYNDDGIRNRVSHSLAIVIVPAYWQTWWFRLLFLALGLGIVYYLLNLRIATIKRTASLKQNIALAEAKALKAQMNPHFLFNSLNAIDNYILNNDAETASNYLSKFSKLIRQILDYSDQPKISLAQEIEVLKLYMKIEQMRFPDRFDFNIHVSTEIAAAEVLIPPMIFQPFVENSIWHGFMHLDTKGSLDLDFHKEEEFLVAIIKDNGVGRSKAESIKSKSATSRKSYGVKVTKERINLLNDLEDQGSDIVIKDNPEGGTIVRIRFPLLYQTVTNH